MNPLGLVEDTCVAVAADQDIVTARMRGRALATQLGFPTTTATLVATAISELARNILLYAGRGEIVLSIIENGHRRGIVIVAQDRGPGIADVPRVMEDGYSTSGRLGLGLPGVRRLTDEFEIHSRVGEGTTVVAKKWNS